MAEQTDISFYLGQNATENIGSLDIPLNNGEIVSINLQLELPEDPDELINFLETEKCPVKYWISVSMAYAQNYKVESAMNVLNKAAELDRFSAEDKVHLSSAMLWLYIKLFVDGVDVAKNVAKANTLIGEIFKVKTSQVEVLVLLAQAVISNYEGKVDVALEIYDELLKINSNNCFALLGKAQILLNKTRNYGSALKLYQQVLMINPLMKPDPRIGIGICFWFLRDHKMARNSWNRALEIDSNNKKALILLNLADFNSTFNNSLSDEEFVNNYTNALKGLYKISQSSKDDPVVLLVIASFYFSKKEYDAVEKFCNKVVTLISNQKLQNSSRYQSNLLSHAALLLGRVSFARAEFTQSQKYFHEAIKLNEDNLMAKLGLGQSQVNRGSNEEAIITFESITKTNPLCLEVNYSLGMLYARHRSRKKQEQAIYFLERYLKLSKNRGLAASSKNDDDDLVSLNQEPIALNAYLVLSKLYESRDINQSLVYLTKAVESRKEINQDAPIEVYNNIGVLNFMKNHVEAATKSFQLALDKLNESKGFYNEEGDLLIDLPDDLKVTLRYNLARSEEGFDITDSAKIYRLLYEDCPNYFSARLRLLFLDCVSFKESTNEEIKKQLEELLELDPSNLEIRSMFGWFVKNFGKKVGFKPDADTTHHKNTLVEYDSHDCYALISLANIYCIMARDIKGQDEKKKKYYIRAIELLLKVLSIDSKNVFAAQGLAIIYIENKEANKGLDILRKIRDSLNDISVYLNLGHVLTELKEYFKAIENYEIALVRYTNGSDAKILSFLGRAWFLRGLYEKRLVYLFNALTNSKKALENSSGSKAALRFNVAYIQFHIAEFVSRLPVEERQIEDIENAISGLNESIEALNSLASDEEKHPPYPKADIKARANVGANTLLNRLNACLEETKNNVELKVKKLEEAKMLREEESSRLLREKEEMDAIRRLKEEEMAKERAKLQEQAQKWAEEARLSLENEDDVDEKLFNEESAPNSKSKKTRKSKTGATRGRKGKGKERRKKVVSESEETSSPSENELEPQDSSKPEAEKSTDGGPKRTLDSEDEIGTPKKRKYLSKETIEDSDEELDDELFDENANKSESAS